MEFTIKIVTNKEEIWLENLTETQAREAIMDAYECITRIDEYITFNGLAKINALDLQHFYIM